ncbi:MAG: alpha/beta fold hydrolase [Myxococcota bacterium]
MTNAADEILGVIHDVFGGADAHEWDRVRAAMTAEVQVDYSDLGGVVGRVSSEELVAGWAAFLPRFDRTVHKLHEVSVHVAGERATATFHGIAAHALRVGERVEVWTVLAGYDTEFVRDDGSWKLARIDLTLRGQGGNGALPQLAMETDRALPVKATEAAPVVERFFRGLETNDLDAVVATLSADVVQQMPFVPEGFPREIRGVDAMRTLLSNIVGCEQSYARTLHSTSDSSVVLVAFDGDVRFSSGRRYQNAYVNRFEVREGRIVRIEEFLDPATLMRAWPGLTSHHSVHPSGASTSEATVQNVAFSSGNETLRGHLFTPNGQPSGHAVLVAGSWTSVKEQMPDVYASRLAAEGFTALTFDFAGFGTSEGAPRQLENPSRKVQDIRAALTFLLAQPGVNRVSGLGICAGAGYTAHAVKEDERFSSLLLVAPWLHDEALARTIYDMRPGGSEGLISAGREAHRRYLETGVMEYVLAASELDPLSAMYVPENAFDYYLNPTKGAGSHYDNRFAVASWEPWITFDGISAAVGLKRPVFVLHSDQGAVPDGARRFVEDVPGETTVVWDNDLTQESLYFDPSAVRTAIEHLKAYLRA